ncbi:hypothetical protein BH24ACI5_BH24ACI5_14230 [soil metagenome]
MAALTARLLAASLVVLAATACDRDVPAPPPETTKTPDTAPPTERVVGPLSEADAAALATMNDRLKAYVDLHKKIEADLPKLPKDASPEQIDQNQRLFEQRVREARKDARQGDIFGAEAQPVIKRLLASVFGGPDGKELMASILDENPIGMKLSVNMRYPDSVPISTVPPEVLQTLPQLSEDMEYRFVGHHLILLDSHAHVVADFIPDAMPQSRHGILESPISVAGTGSPKKG